MLHLSKLHGLLLWLCLLLGASVNGAPTDLAAANFYKRAPVVANTHELSKRASAHELWLRDGDTDGTTPTIHVPGLISGIVILRVTLAQLITSLRGQHDGHAALGVNRRHSANDDIVITAGVWGHALPPNTIDVEFTIDPDIDSLDSPVIPLQPLLPSEVDRGESREVRFTAQQVRQYISYNYPHVTEAALNDRVFTMRLTYKINFTPPSE